MCRDGWQQSVAWFATYIAESPNGELWSLWLLQHMLQPLTCLPSGTFYTGCRFNIHCNRNPNKLDQAIMQHPLHHIHVHTRYLAIYTVRYMGTLYIDHKYLRDPSGTLCWTVISQASKHQIMTQLPYNQGECSLQSLVMHNMVIQQNMCWAHEKVLLWFHAYISIVVTSWI